MACSVMTTHMHSSPHLTSPGLTSPRLSSPRHTTVPPRAQPVKASLVTPRLPDPARVHHICSRFCFRAHALASYSLSAYRPDHPGGRDLLRRLPNHFDLHVHGQLCGNTSHITLCCICKSGCSSRLQNGGCCVLLNRWWPVDWCSRLITQS